MTPLDISARQTGDAALANQYAVSDPRATRLLAFRTRVEGAIRRLARVATVAAVAGGAAGLVLWWSASGRRINDLGQDTAVSVLVLALCLVPAGWLLNVRLALLAALKVPARLGEVTLRRGTQLMGAHSGPGPARHAGRLATVRSLRGVARDYGDVVGSWAVVARLVTPTFWALTAFALLAVPVLVAVAVAAGLVAALG